MPTAHDYGKTRAFVATCPTCERETRGLSTDGRVKTIVRSCSNPPCQARGIILKRDKTKDGARFRVRPSSALPDFPFEIYNFLTGSAVALARSESLARRVASALTGQPPSRYGRTR